MKKVALFFQTLPLIRVSRAWIVLFISGGLQALEKISEKLEAQNFDKAAKNMEAIKGLIENKRCDPNEYASIFPGLDSEEVKHELDHMQGLLGEVKEELSELGEGQDAIKRAVRAEGAKNQAAADERFDELGEGQDAIKRAVQDGFRSVIGETRARDKRDRAREEKERAMAEEIDLKDREIEPVPIARGGFGSVHRAK